MSDQVVLPLLIAMIEGLIAVLEYELRQASAEKGKPLCD